MSVCTPFYCGVLEAALSISTSSTSPHEEPAQFARGYSIAIFGIILWSSTGVFIRYLTETYRIPPLVLAFWRDLFLVLVLAFVFILASPKRLRVARKQIVFLLIFGIIVSLFNAAWTISVALNGAAVATVLAYSSAAFTAILGWRIFGESLGWLKVVAVVASLFGCVFVSGAYELQTWYANPLGILTGLFSGLAFGGYSLMGKEASRRGIDAWTTLMYAFLFAVVFLLLYNLVDIGLPQGIASPNLMWLGNAFLGWLILFILAAGPTIGGYGLYTVSLVYLPASVANLIATMEPVITATLAYIFLGEWMNGAQWFGAALILIGVTLLRIGEGQNHRRRAIGLRKPGFVR